MDEPLLTRYLDRSKDRALRSLLDWLRIPSISADPARAGDVAASAGFCADLLQQAGFGSVEVLQAGAPGGAGGDGGGAPAVYGELLGAGEDAPTVLVYGHHDVQPVDPLEEWTSPPFEPVVSDGIVYARGCSDDKGQMLMQVEAARGVLEERGGLPVNLKFLIEGEEEVGSPHLEDLLQAERERFECDIIVVSDTGMVAAEIPSTTLSMRGLVAFDVTLRSAKSDLHSGLWGGTVPNAALLASQLVASLHDERHRVTLPRFYDNVRELTAEEAGSLAAVPFDEAEFCQQAGVSFLVGEEGRTAYERTGTRPTAEVVGIHSGYAGPGIKTIVPAAANFKVALRLVPDQRPEDIEASFRQWVPARIPDGVQVTVTRHGAVSPLWTSSDHPAVRAVSESIERVWGKAPLFTRSGGSGPEESLGRVLGAPVIFLGVALPTDSFHAPNEHLELPQLWRGILAAGELLVGLGSLEGGR